ncbi:GNAT family N-acetyltransferase [Nocardiopsis algeriensis]|uniref:Putative acetyltransferase n=1 Tax=Nocardiopsis algeriensis TaxID=1478215 RepID=A0A841IV68_9ACTN|nr:GNAT family N-acetyltransferase [Nocardiopsis algeriensis]MBB6120068.1 putative acetyltransferase [Nocardiopsis algeriensis]
MTREQQQETWTVRGSDRDEFPRIARVTSEALLAQHDLDTVLERALPLHDAEGYERFLVAEDEGQVVGTTNYFRFEMALPGGVRPVAGVTGVGVWPTHRRRGVLSALMRRQLADIREAGGRYAALWASEGAIYGRFGYGPAATEINAAVRRPYTALRADAPRDGSLVGRLTDPQEALPDMEEVHRQVAASQNGQFRRAPQWWRRMLSDRPEQRGDKGPLRAFVVGGPGGPQGYALYRTLARYEQDGAYGEVHVTEVHAIAPAAWTALYEHLFSRDLTDRVLFPFLAEDNPLLYLAADRDRVLRQHSTSLWIRLVDVPGALSERSWAAPVEAVLEVGDRFAPWNAGRWRLEADASGARVEGTGAAPDIALDVSHLGAAHLGQTPLSGYLRAGLLTEYTPGAVARLDAALHRPDAPFCGLIF